MTRKEAKEVLMLRKDFHSETAKALDMAIEALSVDTVQGEWKAEINYEGEIIYYECSNCKAAYSLLSGTPEENCYYYCPNCGADMKSNDK